MNCFLESDVCGVKTEPLSVNGLNNSVKGDLTPAVTLSFTPSGKRYRMFDSFGYGLPEILGSKEITVPLLVGDQQVSTYFHWKFHLVKSSQLISNISKI